MPTEKQPEEIVEEILEEADQDLSPDDLTTGTEQYEETDEDVEEVEAEELNFDPDDGHRPINDYSDYADVQDAYVNEDDY